MRPNQPRYRSPHVAPRSRRSRPRQKMKNGVLCCCEAEYASEPCGLDETCIFLVNSLKGKGIFAEFCHSFSRCDVVDPGLKFSQIGLLTPNYHVAYLRSILFRYEVPRLTALSSVVHGRGTSSQLPRIILLFRLLVEP